MNSAEEFERTYLKAKLEAEIMVSCELSSRLVSTSNDLKAALELIEVYRKTYGHIRHHAIEEAEFIYEKATRKGQNTSDVPADGEDTKV